MVFLKGVNRCSRLYSIRKEDIGEEQPIFDPKDRLKDCKRLCKECLDRISKSRRAKQVYPYRS